MYTIKKTRTQKKSIVFQDTYAIDISETQNALAIEYFLNVCSKEMEWLMFDNIKTKVQLFKNDVLKNEIEIHIKKTK
jgi:hypothetical protein